MSGPSDSREEYLLVLRAQTGDREALDRLFQRVQVPLLRHLTLITRNPDDAEDVAQQVFLLVHRKLTWLRDPALFRAWLFRIAARQAIGHVTRRRARGEEELFEMAEHAEPIEQSLTFEEVRRKIGGLPAAARRGWAALYRRLHAGGGIGDPRHTAGNGQVAAVGRGDAIAQTISGKWRRRMTREGKSGSRGLRMAVLAAALCEAVGIALAVWKSMAKG
jgi:RNA polymerase sigma-70 factor, ECF subfamily